MTLEDLFNEKKEEYYYQYSLANNKRKKLSQIIGELEDIYSKTVSPFTAKQEREKLLPKIKNEFKERLSSKTGTSPEEDSKGNLVDEDTKTAEMEKWTNDYLSRIFGGVIKIDNQKISIDNIFKQVVADSVNVKASTRRGSIELQERKQEALLEFSMVKEYLDENPIINKNIDAIIDIVDDKIAGRLDISDETLTEIEVRDTVNMLHGYSDFASRSSRNKIYSYWKKIAGKHQPLCDTLDKLIEVLPDNQETQSLKSAVMLFKKKGKYVQLMKPINVSKKVKSPVKATMDIIDAYVQNELGVVVDEDEDDDSRPHIQSTKDSKETSGQTLTDIIPRQMDILGALYLERYLDGVFLDFSPSVISQITSTTKSAIKEHFGWSSEEQMSKLDKHLRRIQRIEEAKGQNYLPMYILNSNINSGFEYIETEMLDDEIVSSQTVNLSQVNDTIETLFDALLDVLVDQRLMISGQTSAKRGQKYSKQVSTDSYYSAVYSASKQKAKDMKEQKTQVKAVLDAIEDYFYRPLFNPKMTLDINFDFKNDIKFKQLRLVSDSDVGLAYKELFKAVARGKGEILSLAELKRVKNFLEVVNKPNMVLIDVADKMEKLLPVIEELFFDSKKVVETFKDEMASYLGHLYSILPEHRKKQTRAVIFGRKILDSKYEIKDESEITVIMTLQDFFNDPTVSSIMSNSSKQVIKDIKELIGEFKKSEIEDKILSIHDSVRILKQLPVYYGKGSLSSMNDLGEIIDTAKKTFDVDIIGTEIVKMVEEIDAFSNIAKSVGVSEEVVYFVKANFR
tara:strand:- start:854 stop:3232 length:2379 start_codon:yes stop_codon:yes gene_type:complete